MVLVSNIFSQSYLDVIRPFSGMSGVSGAESGVGPATTAQSNAMLGNPALLSYSNQSFLAADMSLDQVSGISVFNTNTSEPSQEHGMRLNSLSYIYPVHVYRGAWVWGYSLQQVNSFNSIQEFSDTDTDSGDLFDYTHRHRSSGSLYALTAATSFLATMHTSVGFAVSYLTGNNTFDKIYTESDSEDNFTYSKYQDSLHFLPEYRGFSARVGVSSELTESVRLGAAIELPSRITVSESSSQNQTEWNDDGTRTVYMNEYSPALKYAVWGPWRLGIGVGFLADPLEVSVNYRFHSYSTSFMSSNLIDSFGADLDAVIDREIDQSIQDVHEFSASVLWSLAPMDLSFSASVMNDPLNYQLGNSLRLDTGVSYQLIFGLGFNLAFRSEQWQSDLNHLLVSGAERNVEVQNQFSQIQFGLKYIL
jgi:hypothetical protein